MKKYLLLLCVLMLVGAGCASAESTPEIDGVPEPVSTTSDTEPAKYRMSSSAVAFTAPDGASITQLDAGAVSAIYIMKGDTSLATIGVYLTTTFDGESIPFSEWKETNRLTGTLKGTHLIDGITFEEHYIPSEDEHHTNYIGLISGGDKDYHIKVTVTERESDIAEALLASIIFYGSETELDGYEIIP